jgi:hypothetical protein
VALSPFAAIALAVVLCIAAVVLCQAAVEHWLERRQAFPPSCRPIVAWGVILGAGYVAFWAWLAANWAGQIVSWGLLAGMAFYWVKQRHAVWRFCWRESTDGHVCRCLVLLSGAAYFGILFLWQTDLYLWHVPAYRFLPLMPPDNELPRLFADRLEAGESPKQLFGDWLSSDRPPLQAGFILLFRPPLVPLESASLNAHALAFTTSFLFQLIWIPGLWAALRGAGAARTEALAAVLLTGCTGFALFHSVYTWPKFGASGLVLGGASLLLFGGNGASRKQWAAGVALCALGTLAHGGVMFSLLALAPFALRTRPRLGQLLAALGAFAILLLPWLCYQRFYEPPGDRLLKWHIAGVIPIDERGFWETLTTSYRDSGWTGALDNKRANLEYLFQEGPWELFDLSFSGSRDRRMSEFAHFFRGLGLGSWLLVLLPGLAWQMRHDVASRSLRRSLWLLIVWALVTLVVWVLLMFGPSTTSIHQGSLIPLLLLWAAPAVLLFRWHRIAFLVVAVAQFVLFASTWVPWNENVNGPLSLWCAALGSTSVLLLGALFAAVARKRDGT